MIRRTMRRGGDADSDEVSHRVRAKGPTHTEGRGPPIGAKRRWLRGLRRDGVEWCDFHLLSTHGCAGEGDAVGVMNQAVQNGIGEGGIADDVVPVLEW